MPNSVAVATTGEYGNGSEVTLFDSGVPRTGSSLTVAEGPLSFGPSASTLYVDNGYIDELTISSAGITQSTQLGSPTSSYAVSNLQYDNGALYLSTGQVFSATTGALNCTFYTTGNTQASGPVVSDSSLGKAFLAASSFTNNSNAIYVFDETTYGLLGSIPINDLGANGYSDGFRRIVRWGQNGVAVSAAAGPFTGNNQISSFNPRW